VDCNDSNLAINPGAAENCTDGIDNDCDGLIDAADPDAIGCLPVCTDIDGDTYALEGGACGPVDCNDADATINPGAAENCTDTIDNDCDGLIDILDHNAVGCQAGSSAPYDFNGDNMSDIVIRDTSGITWKYLMNGNTINSMAHIADIDPVFDIAGVADLTGDQKADIVLKSDSLEAIWLLDGVTSTSSLIVAGLPIEWPVAAVADFNGDGTNDILIQNTNTGILWLYEVTNGAIVGNGNFIGGLEPGWSVVGAGDINGDGMSDIIIRHTTGTTWKYLMTGHIINSMAHIADIDPGYEIVGVADLTGDQQADIVLKSDLLEMIWMVDGATSTSSLMVAGIPAEWPVASVADFNGDGTNDILIQNTITGVLWLYDVQSGAIVGNGNFIGGLEAGWNVQNPVKPIM